VLLPKEQVELIVLGTLLRFLRTRAGLTLQQIPGLSAAACSRMERAQSNPSWTTVLQFVKGTNNTLVGFSEMYSEVLEAVTSADLSAVTNGKQHRHTVEYITNMYLNRAKEQLG
jgi:transcriptional regulator with XRE-family HTH domain